MCYPLEEYSNAGSLPVRIVGRVTKLKISHILIQIHGVALVATECPKLVMDMTISGENKNIMTNVDLLTLAKWCDQNGGVSINSTTDMYLLIPVGSLDTNVQDLNYSIISSADLAANALTITMTAYRLSDSLAVHEFEKRSLPVTPVSFNRVKQIFDINTAYNSAKKSTLTFINNSQMVVPHKTAFCLNQATSIIEAVNTFGLIYSDKDFGMGRQVTIFPDTAFDALIVSYSTLNG